jgi:hypothetical protein
MRLIGLNAMRHQSFTLSRPGLKPGYYVPVRLRVVDGVTLLSGIPMLIAIFAITFLSIDWVKALWPGIILGNPLVFFGYLVFIFLLSSWIVYYYFIGFLRILFLCLGMMTRAESQYFPLEASKRKVDSWPECWQKNAPGRTNS